MSPPSLSSSLSVSQDQGKSVSTSFAGREGGREGKREEALIPLVLPSRSLLGAKHSPRSPLLRPPSLTRPVFVVHGEGEGGREGRSCRW